MKFYFILLIVLFSVISCTKEQGRPLNATNTPVTIKPPAYFPKPLVPLNNPLTEEGILLGRNLYYDNILSENGRSCSSCHIPERSYSLPLFISANGEKKSVPPHINLAWNPDYNWIGNEPVLDVLCIGDFAPEFFNTNMPALVNRLKNHSAYPALFERAFGLTDVSKISHDELQRKIVLAISQFLRTMISSDSRFDKWMRHQGSLTEQELRGMEIFYTEKGDCFHCHGYPLMTSNSFHNNGLDKHPSGSGRHLVTNELSDLGKFSSPTLRNIELTAPYMHDGRFQTLEEVIEFYDSGVQWDSPNIDPLMTKPLKKYGLSLAPQQKEDLLAFLKCLTDTAFIKNPAFRRPVD